VRPEGWGRSKAWKAISATPKTAARINKKTTCPIIKYGVALFHSYQPRKIKTMLVKNRKGTWSLPKGKQEKGETPE
jgi:ADP-ribose pyrophosphatase YjhB (NUDIX family)